MKLIRLQLKPSTPFWILHPIKLDHENPRSPLLDIEKLTEDQLAIIRSSISAGELVLMDSDGNKAISLSDIEMKKAFNVSVEDVEDLIIPNIASVTVSLEEEEDESEKSAYIDEADIILSKNGNTIKKVISSMSKKSKENVKLLEAMLISEMNGKNRAGILEAINSTLRG